MSWALPMISAARANRMFGFRVRWPTSALTKCSRATSFSAPILRGVLDIHGQRTGVIPCSRESMYGKGLPAPAPTATLAQIPAQEPARGQFRAVQAHLRQQSGAARKTAPERAPGHGRADRGRLADDRRDAAQVPAAERLPDAGSRRCGEGHRSRACGKARSDLPG